MTIIGGGGAVSGHVNTAAPKLPRRSPNERTTLRSAGWGVVRLTSTVGLRSGNLEQSQLDYGLGPTGCKPDLSQVLAHRVALLRCGIWSLSGHCGHGRTYRWLGSVATAPAPPPFLQAQLPL